MQNTDKVPKAPKKNPTVKELIDEDEKPYRAKILICAVIDEMPHELGTAHLRSAKPFTKEKIDQFIESDKFIQTTKESATGIYEGAEIKCIYVICNN